MLNFMYGRLGVVEGRIPLALALVCIAVAPWRGDAAEGIEEADREEVVVTSDGEPAGGTHTTSPGAPQFGLDHDGVAELIITRGGSNFRCTGALLSSGRHILTAAHCVTDNSGNLTATSATATFELGSGDVSDSTATIYVHPDYNGDTGDGNDLAIVEFATEWVASVPRYDLVDSGFDAVGLQGVSVGYGRSGHGNTGSTIASGTKRIGLNKWESNGLGDLGLGGITNNETQLTADFDNGLAANDGFDYFFGISDLGYGDDEVGLASGDSGGPTFFSNGGSLRVGGIASYVTTLTAGGGASSDVTPGVADSAFGEFMVLANVGDAGLHNWIVTTAGLTPPVPEPSTAALFAFGVLVALRRRRA